jgi:hypothetical protein
LNFSEKNNFCTQKNISKENFLVYNLIIKKRTKSKPFDNQKNMSEKKFISTKEATEITGKSINTIKSFIQKNFKSDNQNGDQKIKREKAPKGYFWFIEEKFLRESFDIPEKKENSNSDIVELLKKQLETQISQLENKDEQMKIKDEQISQLLERQRESNILLKNSQDKNLMLEAKTEEIEKKGFWKNIFG